MEEVVLGLGANRNHNAYPPLETLMQAVRALDGVLGHMQVSSVYKTGPLYVTEQDDFLNMVVRGGFDGTPRELLSAAHAIENRFGRNRAQELRNGPRTLDIDIELFGCRAVHEVDLVIPHEKMLERAFVLVPLVEILQNTADTQKSALQLYQSCLGRASVMSQRVEKFMDSGQFLARLGDGAN